MGNPMAAMQKKKSAPKRRASVIPNVVQKMLNNPNTKLRVDESLEVIQCCVELGKEAATRAEDWHAVVVIGNTGAGKSTLVNFLHGCDLESIPKSDVLGAAADGADPEEAGKKGNRKKKASKKKVIRVKADSRLLELMKIGHVSIDD